MFVRSSSFLWSSRTQGATGNRGRVVYRVKVHFRGGPGGGAVSRSNGVRRPAAAATGAISRLRSISTSDLQMWAQNEARDARDPVRAAARRVDAAFRRALRLQRAFALDPDSYSSRGTLAQEGRS